MLPTALNYTTAAIEDLQHWKKQFAGQPAIQPITMLIDGLRKSEKFLLPENASLLDVPDVQEHYRYMLRLPYPHTTLEFSTTPETNGGSKKGLVLCMQGDMVAGLDDNDGDPKENIVFIPMFWSSTQNVWHPTAHFYSFNPGNLELLDGKVTKGIHYYEFMPEMLAGASSADIDRDINQNLKFGMDAIIEFCLTVNCENIGTYSIEPPAALNKKREGKGKEPLYIFKVLTIPGEANSPQAIGAGDERNKTRMHLRRGHLRRLQSEKVVWVRHTIVGSGERGVVEKDYKVVTS